MKIAIIAPPWLRTFPGCYYGIENVVENLTSTLYRMGHEVVLFGVGGSTTESSEFYWKHEQEQYKHVHRAWYDAVPVIGSHILHALDIIVEQGDFDIIHDHNSFVGPAMMAFSYKNLPPILHTLHEPFTEPRRSALGIPDNRMLFEELAGAKSLYFNGISQSQLRTVPEQIESKVLDIVPNGVDVNDYIYSEKKEDFFLSIGRISEDKGQAEAVRFAKELNVPFRFAGSIGGTISSRDQAESEIESPTELSDGNVEFQYYRDELRPHLKDGRIEYIGTVFGEEKMKLLAKAKAFLAPINWDEPFGISIIDALASGTPVVANDRGAFSEIIEHGRNGFLAKNEKEFKEYMLRVNEIDPAECLKSVKMRFSAERMAESYEALYKRVIEINMKR